MLANKTSSTVRSVMNAFQRHKILNTLISDCFETALKIEETVTTKSSLFGRPILIKDNFCLRDTMTTCASKMLSNFRAPYTSTVVQRLMDNGAVIVGKSNMDEFSMGYENKIDRKPRISSTYRRYSSVSQVGVILDQ